MLIGLCTCKVGMLSKINIGLGQVPIIRNKKVSLKNPKKANTKYNIMSVLHS